MTEEMKLKIESSDNDLQGSSDSGNRCGGCRSGSRARFEERVEQRGCRDRRRRVGEKREERRRAVEERIAICVDDIW
jgi:hypothetical protein